MASEAEASCESDPNFAIICAFLEKFGELCGVGTMDFVELQNMLENNQEVSPELMNIHIKLLRKTKKNVTVERWERALVNMCHTYSSKDAWEIERFGYKKTRLQVKLRALKELLEMQFDYNTKFKNEINKMSAESLRPQPLGRDKLGRAYWFQTDNNYQIRIYKEDPDEETWHLVAKDREGLLTLMNELADGDSKLSSDSALNEDSNSLSEKPFIDTGQSEHSDEKLPEKSNDDSNLTSDVPTCDDKEETQDDKSEAENTDTINEEVKSLSQEDELKQTTKENADESSDEDDSKETTDKEEKAHELEEVKRPMLRIKSLSELMEKPKETRKDHVLPDLPELTIIKKAKLDTSQITITRKPRNQRNVERVQSPVVVTQGKASDNDNKSSNVKVSEAIEEPVMIVRGTGSGKDCNAGNDSFIRDENKTSYDDEEIFVSEEIEEEVMYIFGEGSGEVCQTGNEKEQPKTQEMEKSKNLDVNTGDSQNKVPTDTVNLEKEMNSTTDSEIHGDTCETTQEEGGSPKKAQFFFGPGSLNIKPCPVSPVINTGLSEESNGKSNENNSKADDEKEGAGEDLAKEEESILKVSKLQDDEEKTNKKNLDDQSDDNDQSTEKIEEELPSQETEISHSILEETGQNETGDEKSVGPKSAEETDDNQEKEIDDSEKIDDDILEKTENETCNIKGASDNKDVLEECDQTEKNEDDGQENKDDVKEKHDIEKEEENQEFCTQENNTEENKDGAKKIKDNFVESEGKVEIGTETQNNSRNDKEIMKKDDVVSKHKDIPDKDGKDEIQAENEKSESINNEDNNKSEEQRETVPEQSEKQDSQADKTDDDTEIIDCETKKPDEKNVDTKSVTVEKDKNTKSETRDSEEDKEGEIEEVELTTVKPEEKKEEIEDQEPGSKRKRVTRNTSTLNESVTKETNTPRKKVTVEKTKKKGQQKAANTNDKEEEKDQETQSIVEITPGRSTRQTRQTKTTPALTKVQATAVTAKPRGRSKVKPQSSKSDETDSPAPLESVTLMDTDNSNTATENPEKDPLAVSEEEPSVVPPKTSLTGFSFDYDPNSPAPVTETIKRGLRKRGRENLEDQQEVPEKDVKRPKMRGKRSVDQSLRKSVEEKRQQVVDASSDENEQAKKPVKTKAVKKVPVKKKAATPSVSDSDTASQKSGTRAKKGARLLKNLGVKEEDISSIADSPAPVRQSRRLAQIKIKEDATRRRVDEEDTSSTKKKKKSVDKDFKVGKRKRIEEEVKPVPIPPMVEKKKKKKAKQPKISIDWESSSGDSDMSNQEEEEVSEYEEHHEEEPLQFKSDHEFSPESDLEGEEPLPLKRARTVRKEESDNEEPEEEFPCQKCGKSDHPEWILLCDKCDNGWHCSCLRPALFVIPEGDWYCPTCQHETLLLNLGKKLLEYDKMMVKKGMEDRRKERLAYVGISLNNVLPAKDKKEKKEKTSSESEAESDSEESDSDEPIYQLRQRRQAHSYKFQDYDDLINSALQEEPAPQIEKTHTAGRGKDIATIVNAAKEEEERNGFDDLPPVVPRDPEESRRKAMSYRKKPKRLNNLEVNSDDEADDSDEDFKGSSSEESEEEYSEDSDDSFVGKKHSRPVRCSTRARTTRFDADFINDDDSDYAPKKKKKKQYFSDSDCSSSDDWYRGKKKKSNKKSKKKKKRFDDSDLENYRKKKPKIKYGMDDSEDDRKGRRTRGKKTSYLDTLGSDSEEETLKKKIKNKSDEEYVAEEDEKESEEDKPSDEEEELSRRKQNSEESDSEEESLILKKSKSKARRAIMDSEDDEEEEKTAEQAEEKSVSPKPIDKNQIINEELAKTVREFDAQIPEEPKLPEEPKVEPKGVEEPKVSEATPSSIKPEEPRKPAVVPGLNVEKLRACGITVTKIAKDKAGVPPSIENKSSSIKLIEIGTKPSAPTQRSNPPINLMKMEKSLEELDEDEVEEMMENEDFANRQLELAAIQIREAKRRKELERKQAQEPPVVITKKPAEMIPKKPHGGRFFNMKPSQESVLGNSSLVMNDDDNDELSEPPGVTLPLFSELGTMNLSKSSNSLNNTPLPAPNRPGPVHGMGLPHPPPGNQVPPNSYGPPMGMMHHHMRSVRPSGPRGNMHPMMGPRVPPMDHNNLPMRVNLPTSIPNVPRNMNVPPTNSVGTISNNIMMGTSAPVPMSSGANLTMISSTTTSVPTGLNMTMASNMSIGGAPPNAHPVGGPNVHPVGGPNVHPVGGPNVHPVGGPNVHPVGGPNVHPVGGPNVHPVGGPTVHPVGGPTVHPVGGPTVHPVGGPNVHPVGGPNVHPVGGANNQSVGSPNVHSGGGPNVHPVGGPNSSNNQGHYPPSINDSPDGTPKKRRGRGKGKKTLAAEAAAAAAASTGTPEANKPGVVKPSLPAANIEIASPPQPFSQSQPAPSVITRMLQTNAGKGAAFPVGRIRPKQFAMMPDSDDSGSPRPQSETQENEMPPAAPPPHPQPPGPPHGGHPPGHYGPPPGQYPPNYYPKDGQPQPPPGYHHQRPPPAPMNSYQPHPSQPPMEPHPMNPPIHQPPISMADSSAMGQYPPPSKSPYEGVPPHRPPYPGSNPPFNYDYAPPTHMPEEAGPPAYDNPTTYPDQFETGSSVMDTNSKSVEDEPGGEFGGLVSYFSSQHEDELDQ